MPQPISTPTALGMITSSAAITPPIGIPIPVWVSGIRQTHLWRKGRAARWRACSKQLSSSSPLSPSHTLIGTCISSSSYKTNICSLPFFLPPQAPSVLPASFYGYEHSRVWGGNHLKKIARFLFCTSPETFCLLAHLWTIDENPLHFRLDPA